MLPFVAAVPLSVDDSDPYSKVHDAIDVNLLNKLFSNLKSMRQQQEQQQEQRLLGKRDSDLLADKDMLNHKHHLCRFCSVYSHVCDPFQVCL